MQQHKSTTHNIQSSNFTSWNQKRKLLQTQNKFFPKILFIFVICALSACGESRKNTSDFEDTSQEISTIELSDDEINLTAQNEIQINTNSENDDAALLLDVADITTFENIEQAFLLNDNPENNTATQPEALSSNIGISAINLAKKTSPSNTYTPLEAPILQKTSVTTEINLIKNPSFETGDTTNWHGDGYVTSNNSYSGSKALTLTGNGADYINQQQIVSVTAGNTYRFQGWLKITRSNTTGNFGFQVNWRDSDGKEITVARHKFGKSQGSQPYTKYVADLVAPDKAVSAKLYLLSFKANGTAFYDQISVTEISTANAENPTIEAKTESQNERLGTTNLSELSQPKTNLIKNHSFETGDTSNWHGDGYVTSNNTYNGSNALMLTGNGTDYINQQQIVSVTAGNTYRFQGWLKVAKSNTTGSFGFQVSWRDSNGKEITAARHKFGLTQGLQPYAEHIADLVAPDNAASAKLYLLSFIANGKAFYDDISITEISPVDAVNLTNSVSPIVEATSANQIEIVETATFNNLSQPNINLISNPGFESDSNFDWFGDGYVTLNNAHSGLKALTLTGDSANYSNQQQIVSVIAGNTYRFQGWLKVTKSNTTGSFGFQVSWRDDEGEEIKEARYKFGKTQGYQQYSEHVADLVAPDNAVSAKLYLLGFLANGTAYYDDISITDISINNNPNIDTSPQFTLVANKDNFITTQNTSQLLNLIENDKIETEQVKLTIVSNPLHGKLELLENGQVNYTPNTDYFGNDEFTYQLSDSVGNISKSKAFITTECKLNCEMKLILSWNKSISPNITKYIIYVWHENSVFSQTFEVNSNILEFSYLAKIKGKYFLSVKAVNDQRYESDYSEVISTTF